MPDTRDAVRSLPFPAVASALGWDVSKFKRHGKDWVGRCYLHGSKTNEACFRYHAETGAYHCFSCHTKGKGCIDITIAFRKCNFSTAVAFLEPLVGKVPLERKEAPRGESDAVEATVLKPYQGKYQNYQVPCPWLETRIPDAGIREKYGVFCYNNPAKRSAYSGRVMIPVKDVEGKLYGYLGRNIGDTSDTSPKYLFPAGLPKSRFLFGAYQLRQHLLALGTGKSVYQQVYLVESPFCCMRFAMMGLPAVSPFGWSVSEEQVHLLRQLCKGVVYLPDLNKAQECHQVLALLSRHLWLRFPQLPADVEDPEFLSLEQIQALSSSGQV